MLNTCLRIITLWMAAASALAVERPALSDDRLRLLGSQLAQSAGSSQWQQLWQRVRSAGYLNPQPAQLHFLVEQRELPGLALETLANAEQVHLLDDSQALYRKDFAPSVMGRMNDHRMTALCLLVDYRAVPATMIDAPQAYLAGASLLSSYPCN
ncbi:hypothetical protein [Pseudomonas shirazensis]|uniref:hypothetical protein n=1 Tax=Pseudomonas shirazensis TaxID=2745494 RepID=UPI003D2C21AF